MSRHAKLKLAIRILQNEAAAPWNYKVDTHSSLNIAFQRDSSHILEKKPLAEKNWHESVLKFYIPERQIKNLQVF